MPFTLVRPRDRIHNICVNKICFELIAIIIVIHYYAQLLYKTRRCTHAYVHAHSHHTNTHVRINGVLVYGQKNVKSTENVVGKYRRWEKHIIVPTLLYSIITTNCQILTNFIINPEIARFRLRIVT